MPSKKQFTQIVLAIFFATQYFFSLYPTEIPITQIKNLASVLKPEYEYLSPIHGAIFCHNDYIENLYRYGNEKDATVRLIKELFFVHHDNITFDRTYLPIKIAAHFSPQDIGQIIAEIENFKAAFLSKITYSKKTKQTIFPSKKETDKLSNNFRTKIKDILENIVTTKKTEIKQSIISYLQTAISRLEQAKPETPEEKKFEIDKKIAELNQQKEAEEQNVDKIVHVGFKISRDNFPKFLSQAILEEGVKYVQHHSIYVLLSFLWKKVANKNDFLDYFQTLSRLLVKPSKTAAPATPTSIFINTNFLSTESEDFLNAVFIPEDYANVTNQPETEMAETIKNDFEALALSYLGFDLCENPLPKEIGMTMNAIFTDNNNQQTSFPDCGETSLRNFLNAILYNSLTKTFDLKRLDDLYVSKDSKLYKFYEKYKTATKIHTLETHNAWANVVSDLTDVFYARINCEISAGIKNMLKVLNHLIPITTPQNPEPSFEGLQEKLNLTNIRTDIQKKYTDKTNNLGKITFNFTIEKQSHFTIIWTFNSGHFQIEYPYQINIDHAKKFNPLLFQALEPTIDSYRLTKTITFLRNYYYSMNDILEKVKNKEKPIQYAYLTLFIQDLHTPEKILNFTKYLVDENQTLDKSTKEKIIKKLYAQLPENDYHIQQQFFSRISIHTNIFNLFANKEFISKSSEKQKIIILKNILTTPTLTASEYHELIEEILPAITDDFDKVQIIKATLNREILDNPKAIKLFSLLYKWIENNLSTIKTTQDKSNIIIAMLNKEIPNNPEIIGFLQKFYQWINDTLFTIKDDQYKSNIMIAILNKEIPTNYEELFTPLYQAIKKVLSTIKDDENKSNIIIAILNKEIFTNPKMIELFTPLYQAIEKVLSTIKDDENKSNIIIAILNKEIFTNPKMIELFTPLYQLTSNITPTIINSYNIVDIIKVILNKEIPTNPETIKLFVFLYQAIKYILTDKPISEGCKICIIELILNKEIPTNPETIKLFTLLYQAIEKILPTITDEYKTEIIESILNKEIPTNPEKTKLFTSFYGWIKDNILAITDECDRYTTTETILNKKIPDNPEQAQLLFILYQAIEKLPSMLTDFQEQFIPQKTQLEKIIATSEKTSIFRRESERIPSIPGTKPTIGRIRSN